MLSSGVSIGTRDVVADRNDATRSLGGPRTGSRSRVLAEFTRRVSFLVDSYR